MSSRIRQHKVARKSTLGRESEEVPSDGNPPTDGNPPQSCAQKYPRTGIHVRESRKYPRTGIHSSTHHYYA